MQSDYAQQYRVLYQEHWWWRAREQAILSEIQRLGLPSDRPLRILDVGCGDGLLFDCLGRFGEVFGVESDEHTIAPDSPHRPRIFLQQFDAGFQPGQTFDLILMLDVLEHLPEPEVALQHARTLLSPGGRLLMTVPALNALWTSHDDINHHYIRYDRHSFRRLADAAGVQLLNLRYFFHWTCPVKLLIRLREWLLPFQPSPPQIPRPAINRLCLAVTRLEQKLSAPLRLPFGSSLLAIAAAPEVCSARASC
jgi:2-polyprenyl-3-methyl-5-hydroxy-6-metoxy-1,4-benzoquinol methylase